MALSRLSGAENVVERGELRRIDMEEEEVEEVEIEEVKELRGGRSGSVVGSVASCGWAGLPGPGLQGGLEVDRNGYGIGVRGRI